MTDKQKIYQIVYDAWDDEHRVISTHRTLESALLHFRYGEQGGAETIKPEDIGDRTDVWNYDFIVAVFPKNEAEQYSIVEWDLEFDD